MPRKKYRWLEVKATKPIEEWRRINKVYAHRHKLRNQLKVRGAELLNKIHNYRLVQCPGPADKLIDEVRKALRLPYAWNQEDFDHAEARLNDIDSSITKIKQRIIPNTSLLANILMLILIDSGQTELEKAKAAVNAVRYIANQLSMEKIESLENDETGYVMTLLRTKDSYYPDWMVKAVYNNILHLFSEKDIEKLTKMLVKIVVAFKNREGIMQAISVDKEDEVVI